MYFLYVNRSDSLYRSKLLRYVKPTIDNNVLINVARVITAIGNHKVGGVRSSAVHLGGKYCHADGALSWQFLV